MAPYPPQRCEQYFARLYGAIGRNSMLVAACKEALRLTGTPQQTVVDHCSGIIGPRLKTRVLPMDFLFHRIQARLAKKKTAYPPTIEDYEHTEKQGGTMTGSNIAATLAPARSSTRGPLFEQSHWRERVRHFTFAFFTLTMATDGTANVIYSSRFHIATKKEQD